MIVNKSHKILLKTTPEHDRLFTSWCGAARWSYNRGLERKIATYQERGRSIGAYALMQEVVALKQTDEYDWLKEVPKSIPRMALMQLDEAFGHFFGRVKEGKAEKGFPRFKSKKRSRLSFHLEPDGIAVNEKSVRIPKLGWVKVHQEIRFKGKLVGTVCISQSAGKWSITFTVETDIGEVENQDKPVTGLDVGVKNLAVLSDRTTFENPKAFYRLERLLARAQQQMARKQRESKRWQRAKLRVQRVHKRIADLRANATHQVSAHVARHYSGVAIEDLNVVGMVKNHNLAKVVLDANFRELHRQLKYKMVWAGGEVRQVERFFPSSRLCHRCGVINDSLTLADREWICTCGTCHNRDENAAINLAKRGWPGVDGHCAGTVRRSHAPDEP
ncbi:MAG: transposase [Candidatus Tectomicrobia bacterium]|nr:transposase [Candidatus Tectomicrobia bacterium]